MARLYGIFLGALTLALSVSGCDSAVPQKSSGQPIQIVLNWFPEAEHGGFYAALVHGYYRAEGLDVSFVPGPHAAELQRVANRQIAFGVANADSILLARAAEADLVALMAPMQDSPRAIIVHERSGIRSFGALRGLTLALRNGSVEAQYLKRQVALEDVRIVPYSGGVSQFLVNAHYAQQGYVFSEPFVIRRQGGDPYCLMVSDLGFNPYASVLFTHAELIREQPDLVARMVRASVRGWQTYLRDPGKTNEYIHKLNPEMERDILDFGVQAMKDLCLPRGMPDSAIGAMTPARWQTLRNQLAALELIPERAVEAGKAFNTRFLEQPAAAR